MKIMGTNAEDETLLINAAANTSTYPSNHQKPTMEHGLLIPLSNAKTLDTL